MTVFAFARNYILICVEIHVAGSSSRGFFPKIGRYIYAIAKSGNHESSTSDISSAGIYYSQRQLSGNGGIDRISTLFEYLNTHHTGQRISRHNGTIPANHFFIGMINLSRTYLSEQGQTCLLYTSDAADEEDSVDLG